MGVESSSERLHLYYLLHILYLNLLQDSKQKLQELLACMMGLKDYS